MDPSLRIFIMLILTCTALVSCSGAREVKGQYGYASWDGRHGHYGRIKVSGNRFKRAHWSSNFFRPTKVEVQGKYSFDRDSILFTPSKISFYRPSDAGGKTEYKKVKCGCDTEGLQKVDSRREWYIVASCKPTHYFLNQDTLIEGGTKIKFARTNVPDHNPRVLELN